MSNYPRESNTVNRNLQDLRVNCRTNPANILTTGLNPVKVLDILNFNFDENIFPGSPCPRENLIGMPSPHLYEVDIQDVFKKNFINGGVQEEQPTGVELDPLLEDSVDISELLNSAEQINEEELEKYIFGQNQSIDLAEGLSANNLVTVNNDIAPTVLSEVDFMTNPTEIQSSSSGWQIVTIKADDLGSNVSNQTQLPSPVDERVTSTWPTVQSPGPLTPPISPAPPTPQRGRPGRKPSGNGPVRTSRKRAVEKDTEEYKDKRQRNNVAVRKSRDKAKIKQVETEQRVENLVTENEGLQKKVELLSKELQVLKSLFINVGAALPANFEKLLSS